METFLSDAESEGRSAPLIARVGIAGLFAGSSVLIALFAASTEGPHGALSAPSLALLALVFAGIAAGLLARREVARQAALVVAAGVGAVTLWVAPFALESGDVTWVATGAALGKLFAAGLVGWGLTRRAVRGQFRNEQSDTRP